MKGLKIDEQMKVRIIDALKDVWNRIGDDCLVDDMGNPDESATMSGADVRAIVADQFVGNSDNKELVDAFRAISHTAQQKLLKEAFPGRYYGC
jgi:hypothetical protein